MPESGAPGKAGKTFRSILTRLALRLGFAALVVVVFLRIPASSRLQVTERYRFDARADSSVSLAILLPTSGHHQQVSAPAVTWTGAKSVDRVGSLNVVRAKGQAAPGAPAEAVIDYNVTIRQDASTWDAAVEPKWLAAETEIESTDPLVAAEAARVAAGSTRRDAYRICRSIGRYVHEPRGSSATFGGEHSQSALKALRTGEGVCGENANLMAAFCRAKGIPARAMKGLAFIPYPPLWPARTAQWSHPGVSHAWVEFHTGRGWEQADPTMGKIPVLAQLAFGRTSGDYLTYGEISACAAAYDDARTWVESKGIVIGAMDAPLMFVAGASSNGVTVMPSVTVRKGWDGRWVAVLALGVVASAVRFALKRRRKARERAQAAVPTA